jgi:hypothetical protein
MNNQRLDFSGFTRVRIERALSVDILRADSYSVTIGDDFSRIRMEVIGDTLCIERRGMDWIAPFHPRPHVVVTMPLLREITLGGACQCKVIGFRSNENLALKLNGASQLETNSVTAGNIKVDISGASNLTGDISYGGEAFFKVSGASRIVLQGSGNNSRLDISGASQARLENLALHNADLKLSGASSAQLRVSDRIDFDLSGASRMEYIGNAIVGKMQINGASQVNHR